MVTDVHIVPFGTCGGLLWGAFPWWPSHPFGGWVPLAARPHAWGAPTSFESIRSLVTRLWNVELTQSDTVSLDEILRQCPGGALRDVLPRVAGPASWSACAPKPTCSGRIATGALPAVALPACTQVAVGVLWGLLTSSCGCISVKLTIWLPLLRHPCSTWQWQCRGRILVCGTRCFPRTFWSHFWFWGLVARLCLLLEWHGKPFSFDCDRHSWPWLWSRKRYVCLQTIMWSSMSFILCPWQADWTVQSCAVFFLSGSRMRLWFFCLDLDVNNFSQTSFVFLFWRHVGSIFFQVCQHLFVFGMESLAELLYPLPEVAFATLVVAWERGGEDRCVTVARELLGATPLLSANSWTDLELENVFMKLRGQLLLPPRQPAVPDRLCPALSYLVPGVLVNWKTLGISALVFSLWTMEWWIVIMRCGDVTNVALPFQAAGWFHVSCCRAWHGFGLADCARSTSQCPCICWNPFAQSLHKFRGSFAVFFCWHHPSSSRHDGDTRSHWAAMKDCLFTRGPLGWTDKNSTMHCLAELDKALPDGSSLSIVDLGLSSCNNTGTQVKTYYLSLQYGWSPSAFDMTEFFRNFEEKDYAIQTKLDELQGLKVQVWRTRKGICRKKHFLDVRDVNTGDGLLWNCRRKVKEGYAGAYNFLFAGCYYNGAFFWRSTHERWAWE